LKYGYFNYDPVGPSIFFYTDDAGQPREMNLNIDTVERLIEAVSGLISGAGIDHVVANAAGMGLSGPINQYLSTSFNYNNVEFEMNN